MYTVKWMMELGYSIQEEEWDQIFKNTQISSGLWYPGT